MATSSLCKAGQAVVSAVVVVVLIVGFAGKAVLPLEFFHFSALLFDIHFGMALLGFVKENGEVPAADGEAREVVDGALCVEDVLHHDKCRAPRLFVCGVSNANLSDLAIPTKDLIQLLARDFERQIADVQQSRNLGWQVYLYNDI